MKTLPFYKDYFNVAYPLPKMDLIAIADFAAGTPSTTHIHTHTHTHTLTLNHS